MMHLRCSANFLNGEAMCELCEEQYAYLYDPEDEEDEEDDDGIATTGTEDTPGLLPTPIV